MTRRLFCRSGANGESQVPAFLARGKTLLFDGTSLAILLAGYVLVAGVAAVIASPLQHLALRADHMVSPVLKAPLATMFDSCLAWIGI